MAMKPGPTCWWALADLVADRSDQNQRLRSAWPLGPARRALVRMSIWIKLAGGLGRTDAGGTAVVCLTPPTWRGQARCATLAIGAGAALAIVLVLAGLVVIDAVGPWWEPALALVVVVVSLALAPAARVGWCCYKGDRRLRDAKPAGGWYLRDFAGSRDHPGAGKALLEQVCDGADAAGRVLYLDTSEPRLVIYYEDCEFSEDMSEAMAWGRVRITVTRMVRLPKSPRPLPTMTTNEPTSR